MLWVRLGWGWGEGVTASSVPHWWSPNNVASWDVGVAWQDGRGFQGPCHIRMNLASPRSRIEEAFGRLDKYVFGM